MDAESAHWKRGLPALRATPPSWGGNKCCMDSSLLSPGKGKMPSRKHAGRELGTLTNPRVRFLQLEAGPGEAQPWTGLL